MTFTQEQDKQGRFTSPYQERRADKPIQFRLPVSLDRRLRLLVAEELGVKPEQLTSIDLRPWFEEAVRSKIEGDDQSFLPGPRAVPSKSELHKMRDRALKGMRYGSQSRCYQDARAAMNRLIDEILL